MVISKNIYCTLAALLYKDLTEHLRSIQPCNNLEGKILKSG